MNKKIGELIKNNYNKFCEIHHTNNLNKDTKLSLIQEFVTTETDEFKIEFSKRNQTQFNEDSNSLMNIDEDSQKIGDYQRATSNKTQNDFIEMKQGQLLQTKEDKSSSKNKKIDIVASTKNNIRKIEQEDEDYFYSSKKKPRYESNVNLIFKSKWTQAKTTNALDSSDGIYLKFSNENSTNNFIDKSTIENKSTLKLKPILKSDDEVSLDSDIEIPDF
jgi:hypothetical protein